MARAIEARNRGKPSTLVAFAIHVVMANVPQVVIYKPLNKEEMESELLSFAKWLKKYRGVREHTTPEFQVREYLKDKNSERRSETSTVMENEHKKKILDFIAQQEQIDPAIQESINTVFWDLL